MFLRPLPSTVLKQVLTGVTPRLSSRAKPTVKWVNGTDGLKFKFVAWMNISLERVDSRRSNYNNVV